MIGEFSPKTLEDFILGRNILTTNKQDRVVSIMNKITSGELSTRIFPAIIAAKINVKEPHNLTRPYSNLLEFTASIVRFSAKGGEIVRQVAKKAS